MGEVEREGFAGAKGDEATIRITDSGDGVQYLVTIPPGMAGTAVEAAVDLVCHAIGFHDWRERNSIR